MKQPEDPTAIVQIASQADSGRWASQIKAASKNTGVSFSYLMAQANKESAFVAGAGSTASSAAGLFQFTKGTWLQLIKLHGETHGLGDLASHIHRTLRGDYVVSDPKLRQKILDLRRDPQTSSLMAGEYANDNKSWLEKSLGRKVNSTELYMAHFLGPGGAVKVLKAKALDEDQPAAALLPQAAEANPAVFFDSSHTPRSVAAVYDGIRHAIERPMRHYARLEEAKPAALSAGHPQKTASRATDPAWPFETGVWPPVYVPPATASISPAPSEAVAYTNSSQSADQISAPMPPAPGSPPGTPGQTPLGQLLKNLFG